MHREPCSLWITENRNRAARDVHLRPLDYATGLVAAVTAVPTSFTWMYTSQNGFIDAMSPKRLNMPPYALSPLPYMK